MSQNDSTGKGKAKAFSSKIHQPLPFAFVKELPKYTFFLPLPQLTHTTEISLLFLTVTSIYLYLSLSLKYFDGEFIAI